MGDKIFFPNSAQFDEMNKHLARIASAVGSHVDISTWGGIQKAVRAGIAPDVLPIGTVLSTTHDHYGTIYWNVVAHDYFKSVHNENAHTMTLLCQSSLGNIQFDEREAFYYAEDTLPAGTYNFTLDTTYSNWTAGTYQFTLTKPVPKGGVLVIWGYSTTPLSQLPILSYEANDITSITETTSITLGKGGVSLGTFGVELNHTQRVSTGSNNYKESAIRQFLNSAANSMYWWIPLTKFDRPPNNRSPFGFAHGFDNEFLSCVGTVTVPCAANSRYESPDSTVTAGEKYTVADRFYLASQAELGGIKDDVAPDDSLVFPYFKDATNADRIKYTDGAVTSWWTRSANRWSPNISHAITSVGVADHATVSFEIGLVPACTIV